MRAVNHWGARALLAALAGAAAVSGSVRAQQGDLAKPLVVASQGSFFVGGQTKSLGPAPGRSGSAGDVTVNQMYVSYQTPPGAERRTPVVMVHGCCLSSKTWETTPDGRMGWNEYFVRRGRAVYLADQVSRARSGFDATSFAAVKAGTLPPSALPNIINASHQIAWTVFRFGPSYPQVFPDGQFPVEAVDELYKQMIPDLNALLPNPNPTWANMAALAVRLRGAVLMGHSESGFFPEQAALIDPSGIRGMISIEQPCPTDLAAGPIATLAKIPTLIMFGDHLGDVQAGGPANWAASLRDCEQVATQIKAAGGDVEVMHLPKMGIKGNSHMLMQDRNNLQLADLILAWLDRHVDGRARATTRTR
jgi:pimeloyl-ACP methyl ester carboxylesterase